ncbi:MBL fold metallo-hydrolase [Amycolatopsis jejuensis]|uniref:MBL fold metallo-hydrolase n=1 Tax=Amycolatopsis jejuensis TaxID=330084 RepID=UPI00068AB9A1|nr:MBL fold metallo-hydrolase [Amycolatopsis jejuensis]
MIPVDTIRAGDVHVSHLSDGALSGPRRSWFTGADPAEWVPVVGVADPDTPFPVNFGGFVITGDGHVTLVDTGWGHRAHDVAGLDGAGEMLDRLAGLGIAPEDVDRIVQTHLHADHCGWLVKDDAYTPTFPNATVYLHEAELAYWTGDEVEKIEANRKMLAAVRPRVEAVRGRLSTFDGEVKLSDAVTILPTPGHTPGHVCVMVSAGGQTVLLAGDLAHHPVHLDHHHWLPVIDYAPEQSVASREYIAQLAAERDAVVLAPHFPIPTRVQVQLAAGGGFHAVVLDRSAS